MKVAKHLTKLSRWSLGISVHGGKITMPENTIKAVRNSKAADWEVSLNCLRKLVEGKRMSLSFSAAKFHAQGIFR